MKAAIVHQFNKPLRIEQVAIPEPGPGEVLVTVSERRLDDINDIFAEMKEGQIEGRIVLSQL